MSGDSPLPAADAWVVVLKGTPAFCRPCGGVRIAASVRSENDRPAVFDEAIAHFRHHLLPAGVVSS
jgi:hypothetical protein